MRQLLAGLIVIAVAVAVELVLLSSSAAPAPRYLESMFQDDNHLIYAPTATVTSTLDKLRSLGVDTLRVTMLWKLIAPQPTASSMPAGFRAADPGSYPAAGWAPYDRVVELARSRGMSVDFNLTAPGPLWAMAQGPPSARAADHWIPSPAQFGQFVAAVGRRYSGAYTGPGRNAPVPRVSYWSIWNEPNQPGWLSPQWQMVARRPEMVSPALYRGEVREAYAALARTGHGPGKDTILVGELAPEGCDPGTPCPYAIRDRPIPPIEFVRALYCVDGSDKPLTGNPAAALECPPSGDRRTFVAANPGLFQATGFGHHPYAFFLAPTITMSDPNFVPLSDLGRLERALDGIFAAYGVSRQLPLFLTEYGYETNPPNPFRGVDPGLQSRYLDEAVYMAWRDPRVRALSQFLLFDSPPDSRYPPGTQKYWSTFQTGLQYQNGAPKPSLSSYRLPLFVPDPVLGAGQHPLVWAMLRAAPHDSSQVARVQWQPLGGGSFRTVLSVSVRNPNGVLAPRVSLPGAGFVRVAWRLRTGRVVYSRAVTVRVL